MSHIHLPFGVISPVWSIAGYILMLLTVFFCASKIKKEELSKKVPFIGIISALMLITMSIPLGFIPFHINLTILAGILAGPYIGFIAVFIVNLILSFLGHGGIDAVGINTLIIGFEVAAGYCFFNLLKAKIKPVAGVICTTVITLTLSTSLMVGMIGVTNAGWVNALPHGHHEEVSEEYMLEDKGKTEEISAEHGKEENHEEETVEDVLGETRLFSFTGWAAVGTILLFGIIIEALVTALVVGFFLKIRPDIIINN